MERLAALEGDSMKKQIPTLALVGGVLLAPGFLVAQGAAANSSKIAVISIQAAIASTAEGKKAFGDLEKKYDPRRQELQRQQQEIQGITDQLQKQTNTLSDEEKLRLGRQLEEKQKLFKRAQEDASSDFQAENQDVFRRLYDKMSRVIAEYAQQHGYVLVIDDTQLPVHYVAKEIDITEDIVKRYDAAHPGGDASAPELTSPGGPPRRTTPPSANRTLKPTAPAPKPPDKPNP